MTGMSIPIPSKSINTVRNIVISILFLNIYLIYHIGNFSQNMYTMSYDYIDDSNSARTMYF
jgi:hypothetical protein